MNTDGLTWKQRRELERELWLEHHLRVLGEFGPDDLDDVLDLRAIETHARMLADLAAKVRRARLDDAAVEAEVQALRAELDRIN